MPPESAKLLVKVLSKIPIFQGLVAAQVKKILSICAHKSFQPGEVLCRSNTESDEMYILLSGQLAVVTVEGVKVATINPVTTVGEMGVITGQPRSATVEVIRPSNIFTIRKNQFDVLIREDSEMRVQVYRHIADVLVGKLGNDNVQLRDYQIARDDFIARITTLEQQVSLAQRRIDMAMEVAEGSGDIARDEIGLYLDDRLKELVPQVLIVDDEKEFRQLVIQALPAVTVLEASDGREALEIVQEEKLDLVITDVRMPIMDGFGLLTQLRSQFAHLPVLAISGFIDAVEVEKYDFDGFITKPLDLGEFQARVQEIIYKSKPVV